MCEGEFFRRQNLTSTDVRFGRLKTVQRWKSEGHWYTIIIADDWLIGVVQYYGLSGADPEIKKGPIII